MTFPIPYPETVTLLRRTKAGTDDYGNDQTVVEEVELPGCAVWDTDGNASGANEDTERRDSVTRGLTVVDPSGTDVRPVDQVRARGLVWDVHGQPTRLGPSPLTGAFWGTQITLKRIDG